MDSIKLEEKFIPCPVCDYPVSSNLPTCEKCGLEISGGGIYEIVHSEETEKSAIEDARKVFNRSVTFLIYSFISGFLFDVDNGFVALYMFAFWLCLSGLYVFYLIRWQRNYWQTCAELDILEKVSGWNNASILVFVTSIFMTIYFVWSKL